MKIGIDLDDVVVDFFPSFLDFHNQRHGTCFKLGDITSYHIWEVGIGNSKEEVVSFIDEFYESEDYGRIPFVEGAREGLDEIRRENDICVITSRFFRYEPKTRDFVQRNFPEGDLSLHFTSDFGQDGYSKAEICKKLGVDYYVEDCYHYAQSCAQRGIKTLLLRKPWNERYWISLKPKGGLLVPVKNWKEIVKEIKGVKDEKWLGDLK